METTIAEICMLLGSKVIEIHEKDKQIKQLKEELGLAYIEMSRLDKVYQDKVIKIERFIDEAKTCPVE